MNRNLLVRIKRRVQGTISRFLPTGIYHCADDPRRWAVFWVGYYLTKTIGQQFRVRARLMDDPWGLRKQIVHFGNRYAFFHGPREALHRSNRVFLTWFHGDRSDPNPEMKRMLDQLPDACEFIEKIVTPCSISRAALREIGIPEEKIEVIPLGVDLEQFIPPSPDARAALRREMSIPKESICIANFQKDGEGWEEGISPKRVKGPDVFLDVIASVAKRCSRIMVLLTGPARGFVKRGLEKIGVPYIHRFLHQYHEVVPYYQAADLYLIASRTEGGPQALLESWATGLPVVSTRVGMCADHIRHGENGMLADVEDVASLTEMLVSLIEDPTLRERCRAAALEDVRRFEWSLIGAEYYRRLYEPFLGKGCKPPCEPRS